MSNMIKINLKALSPTIPGRGQLFISGWQFATDNLKFTIQRNQDQFYLGDKGVWSPSVVYHQIALLNAKEASFFIDITPDLLDPLLKLTGTSFKLELNDSQGNSAIGVLILEEGLLSSSALGQSPVAQETQTVTSTVAAPAELPVETEADKDDLETSIASDGVPNLGQFNDNLVSGSPIANSPALGKSSRLGKKIGALLLLLSVVLAAIAGALYYIKGPEFFDNLLGQSENASNPSALGDAKANTPLVFNQENLNSACLITDDTAKDELTFVKNCIQSSPSGADLMKVIGNAKAKNLCQIAQRIYAYKSQAGDKQITLAYAREFDPATHQKAGCFALDKETAIYWYEKVLANDPLHEQANARIKALRP